MANYPTIILIDSPKTKASATFAECLKKNMLHSEKNARIFSFPSDGIIGHQLRVVEQGRYQLDENSYHAFLLIDRMDLFFNPQYGIQKNGSSLEVVIIVGNFLSELQLSGASSPITAWVESINAILPPPDIMVSIDCTSEQISHLQGIFPAARHLPVQNAETINPILEEIVSRLP